MTEKDTELKGRLVVGHKSDGRSIYDLAAKKELVAACLRPGVSVARMAMQHGVNANLLRTWIAAHQRQSIPVSADSTASFVAVQIEAEQGRAQRAPHCDPDQAHTAASQLRLNSVAAMAERSSSAQIPTVGLQVRLPNGVRLDLGCTSLKELPTLMQMLSRLPCSASTKD